MTRRGPLIVLSDYFLARVWICQLSPCHGLATAGKTPTASEAEIRTGEVGRHWGPYGESEAKPALGLSGATFALSRRGFSMNIKHSIVALGAAGATAALVFGGSAVSTAFTSQSPTQTDSVHAAPKTGITVDHGTSPWTNARPGRRGATGHRHDHQHQQRAGRRVSLTLGTPQVVPDEYVRCARPEQLEVSIDGLHREPRRLAGPCEPPVQLASLTPARAATVTIKVRCPTAPATTGTGPSVDGDLDRHHDGRQLTHQSAA